jgi:hypothetical protein
MELNPSNYDDEDLTNLIFWASQAYDEISTLQYKVEVANKRLEKINDFAETV